MDRKEFLRKLGLGVLVTTTVPYVITKVSTNQLNYNKPVLSLSNYKMEWKRELTADEIKEIWNNGESLTESTLYADATFTS